MKRAELFRIAGWIIAGSLANVVLGTLNRVLGLPFFLDSIFTAVLAATAGTWAGLATAVLSQLLIQLALMVTENQAWGLTLPFVLCQMVTAVVIGQMTKHGVFGTPLLLVVAIFAVALGNSIVGSFVATFVFGGINLHSADFLAVGLVLGGQSLMEASFWARVPINLFDKSLAVVAAYGAVVALARNTAKRS